MKSLVHTLRARLARPVKHVARPLPSYTGYSTATYPTPCPRCQGATRRVPRRFQDLLVSIVRPVSRHQCCSLECGWVGSQRHRRRPVLIQGPW